MHMSAERFVNKIQDRLRATNLRQKDKTLKVWNQAILCLDRVA